MIQNKSGVFLVQAFDDSTTICSDYFEKDIRGWLATPTLKTSSSILVPIVASIQSLPYPVWLQEGTRL